MDRILKLVIATALIAIAVKLPVPQAVAQANETALSRRTIEDLSACIAAKSKADNPFNYNNRCFN